MISEKGRERFRTHRFAPIDIDNFVKLGAPRDAFSGDGILDVDRLIDLGWEIDANAEALDPPGQPLPG